MRPTKKQPHPSRYRFAGILMAALCLLSAGRLSSAFDSLPMEGITYATSPWKPFNYEDQGKCHGLYIDILKEIFEIELGIPLHCRMFPWKRAQASVESGKADFLVTVATGSRLAYAVKSRLPILELYLYVYTYKGHPKQEAMNTITSGRDIRRLDLVPVTNLGNLWHKDNIEIHGVHTEYVPAEANAFQFLARKRADITIEPLYAGNYLISKLGLADRITPTRGRFGPTIFHLLLSKRSTHAKRMNQIDQAIEKVKGSPRYREILDHYETIKQGGGS